MNNELSLIIKNARKDYDMTQQQLADSIGVSKSYINKIEHGQTKKPSLEVLNKLASILQLDYVDIIETANYDIEDLITKENIIDYYMNYNLDEELHFKYIEGKKEVNINRVLEDYREDKISSLDTIYLFIYWIKQEEDKKFL